MSDLLDLSISVVRLNKLDLMLNVAQSEKLDEVGIIGCRREGANYRIQAYLSFIQHKNPQVACNPNSTLFSSFEHQS